MQYSKMSHDALLEEQKNLLNEFQNLKDMHLSLNMARGKPGSDQLDLSMDLLKTVLTKADCIAANGFDCRNYGVLDGMPECKALFAEMLSVPEKNVIIGGTSSLNLMFDFISQCVSKGIAGEKPWLQQGDVKFICNVPGYDRHFSICEYFGIQMINVPMVADGVDVAKIAELVKDEKVKGMFCVPKYSNPNGITYSDANVRAIAALKPAAKDFRVIWDNAYIVHDLTDTPDTLLNIFDVAKEYGTEDHFVEFTSTSKISFPGAGVSAIAASDKNIAEIKERLNNETISYDKLNQLRHVRYFKNLDGIKAHMKKHAALIAPKFQAVLDGLAANFSENPIAKWTKPNGGYFISLDTVDCSAKRVGELCKELGVTLTTVGATYPYGKDPDDKNIRIAPSLPPVAELQKAVEVLCLCIKLATLEKLI